MTEVDLGDKRINIPWGIPLLVVPLGAGLVTAGMAVANATPAPYGLFPVWYTAVFAAVAESVLVFVSGLASLLIDVFVKRSTGKSSIRLAAIGLATVGVSVGGGAVLTGGSGPPSMDLLWVGLLNAAAMVAVVGTWIVLRRRRLAYVRARPDSAQSSESAEPEPRIDR